LGGGRGKITIGQDKKKEKKNLDNEKEERGTSLNGESIFKRKGLKGQKEKYKLKGKLGRESGKRRGGGFRNGRVKSMTGFHLGEVVRNFSNWTGGGGVLDLCGCFVCVFGGGGWGVCLWGVGENTISD